MIYSSNNKKTYSFNFILGIYIKKNYIVIIIFSSQILGNTSSTIGCEHTKVDPKKKVLKQETTNVSLIAIL